VGDVLRNHGPAYQPGTPSRVRGTVGRPSAAGALRCGWSPQTRSKRQGAIAWGARS
jgi:hypothetical protein